MRTYDIVIGEFGIENFEICVVDMLEDCCEKAGLSACRSREDEERGPERRGLLIEGVFDCE